MEPQIVKFQRSLFSSDSGHRVMYYNEDRTLLDEIPLTKEFEDELFPNGEDKVYHMCELGEDKYVHIGDKVESEPDW